LETDSEMEERKELVSGDDKIAELEIAVEEEESDAEVVKECEGKDVGGADAVTEMEEALEEKEQSES
jgi:hypothetical protein